MSVSGGGSIGGGNGGGGTSGIGAGSIGGGAPQPFQRVKDGDRSKLLILRGPNLLIDSAISMLAKVDIKPLQVQVEVKVVDVSPEKLAQAGFDYSWRPFTFFELPKGTGVRTQIPDAGTIDFDGQTRPPGLGIFSRLPMRFDILMNGLITKKDAKLLANPNIMVVDNDDATIFIGDTLRTQLSSTGALGGTNVQVVEFPVGIILLLRPRVNADGNVTMRVHPIVSAITSIGDNNLPQTSTREAETTVVVKDGETIVMGGLIRDEMIKTVRELPILADLPLVGELFRSRSSSHKRSDIMLFITTRLVKDTAEETNRK